MSTKQSIAKKQTKENSYTLRESKKIENSPFTAHKYGDFWIITCGKFRHESNFESYDEACSYVNTIDWSLVALAITAITELVKSNNEHGK